MSENQSYRQTHRSLSLLDNAYSHTWYVGFGECNSIPSIYRMFCKPEWSHCYCFAQVGPFVQVINPGWDRVEVGLKTEDDGTPLSADEYARRLNEERGHTIIKLTNCPERLRYKSIWGPTCVSFVKTILGYNTGWLEFNPRRLFVHMMKNGAELVHA